LIELKQIDYKNELSDFINKKGEIDFFSLTLDINKFPTKVKFFKEKIVNYLKANKVVYIKRFGISKSEYIFLNRLISKDIYYSKRMGVYVHNFKIRMNAHDLSEEIKSGSFHTDFTFQNISPDFISLQCISPDPKYPYLGINYLVSTQDIFNVLIEKFNFKAEYLLDISLPYTFDKITFWIKPFYLINNNIEMKIHLRYIDRTKLNKDIIYLINLVEQVAMNLSKSITLNKGDVLLFSNKTLLHKRGECSIDLLNNQSRELNSIRFFI